MERSIICTGLSLEQRMTVARLHFDETILGEEKPRHIFFDRDFVLKDYRQRGTLPKQYNAEGQLVHQNPVFLSGHLRGAVVSKICDELTTEFYPDRKPQQLLSAIRSFQIKCARIGKGLDTLADNITETRTALEDIDTAYTSDSFSMPSFGFYSSTKKVLSSFGRGEGDDELSIPESDDCTEE